MMTQQKSCKTIGRNCWGLRRIGKFRREVGNGEEQAMIWCFKLANLKAALVYRRDSHDVGQTMRMIGAKGTATT